jgi:hypothetical protein
MVFEPVLESSKLPLTVLRALDDSGVNGARVGAWRGCLVRSLLGSDVFPRGAMRWMGWPSPLYLPTVHSHLPRGHGLPMRHRLVLSWWWSPIFFGGKEASRGVVIGWRFCPHWYMSMEYRIVKWDHTRQ